MQRGFAVALAHTFPKRGDGNGSELAKEDWHPEGEDARDRDQKLCLFSHSSDDLHILYLPFSQQSWS